MKKKFYSLLLVIFIAGNLFSQKSEFGFSVSAVSEMNWNIPLESMPYAPPVTLYSKLPVRFGVNYERVFKTVSPSAGLNLVYRTINYSDFNVETNFKYYALELPVNANFHKVLSQDLAVIFNLGAGVNYILSSEDDMKAGLVSYEAPLYYLFEIITPNKLGGFATGGMGMECSLKKAGKIQFRMDFTYQFAKQLQYEWTDQNTTIVSEAYRMNYGSIGLVYLFP